MVDPKAAEPELDKGLLIVDWLVELRWMLVVAVPIGQSPCSSGGSEGRA